MKIEKLEAWLYCAVAAGLFVLIFCSIFIIYAFFLVSVAVAILPYFMTPQYYWSLALREYELEEAIINILRSAGAITGRKDDWITVSQVLEEVAKKVTNKESANSECWVVINSLVRREIVETGSVSGNVRETFCRLVDKSYRPRKPDNSIKVKEGNNELCMV